MCGGSGYLRKTAEGSNYDRQDLEGQSLWQLEVEEGLHSWKVYGLMGGAERGMKG